MESFDVNVKNFQGGSVVIKVYSDWDVARVKTEIANKMNVNPDYFQIVFAGQTLLNKQTLWDIGLQGYSTLHCIRIRESHASIDISLKNASDKLGVMESVSSSVSQSTSSSETDGAPVEHRFYVYCKRPCGDIAPGKLRVRCADCKDSSFILTRGPDGWDDVLKSRRLHGRCNNEACGKFDAEFYFKCASHRTEETEDSVALHMVRANTMKVECAVCLVVYPKVVVFGCQDGHSLCIECFVNYCKHQLVNRQFIQDSTGKGYTIRCPASCPGSEVTEIHHFRMMGKNGYAKYQAFGTEECILQMGGVLCPNRGCGQGLLPEEGRRVQCPALTGGCGHVFCRNCKCAYHDGSCQRAVPETQQGQAYQVNPENLERARWIEATERFIQNNTNIKPCPRCQVPTEKNGGCMHMTCMMAVCKYEWCWICGVEWNRTCQSSHWFG